MNKQQVNSGELVDELTQKMAEVRVLWQVSVEINSTLDLDRICDIGLRTKAVQRTAKDRPHWISHGNPSVYPTANIESQGRLARPIQPPHSPCRDAHKSTTPAERPHS